MVGPPRFDDVCRHDTARACCAHLTEESRARGGGRGRSVEGPGGRRGPGPRAGRIRGGLVPVLPPGTAGVSAEQRHQAGEGRPLMRCPAPRRTKSLGNTASRPPTTDLAVTPARETFAPDRRRRVRAGPRLGVSPTHAFTQGCLI